MKRLIPALAGLLLVFSISASPVLAEPCKFFGSVTVNGIPGDSPMVTAHRSGTGELLADGMEGIIRGQYVIEVNGSLEGTYVSFSILGNPADQESRLCEAGKSERLDLTANLCTDCDGDGFPSLLWGGGDCNDRDPRVHPDKREICGNGIDENCDGIDAECPECEESWLCTTWSGCINGERTRTCVDVSRCGTTLSKPAQVQACEIYGAGIVCSDGDRACDGDLVMECFAGQWRQAETCESGCLDGACSPGGITGFIAANPAAFWGGIALVIIIIAGLAYRRMRW